MRQKYKVWRKLATPNCQMSPLNVCSSTQIIQTVYRYFVLYRPQRHPCKYSFRFRNTSLFINSISSRSLILIILPKIHQQWKVVSIKHGKRTHIPHFRRQSRISPNLCYLFFYWPVVDRVPPSTHSSASTVAAEFGVLVPVFPAGPEEGYGNALNEWHAYLGMEFSLWISCILMGKLLINWGGENTWSLIVMKATFQ